MQQVPVGVVGFGLAGRVFHAPFVDAVPGLALRSILQRTGEDARTAWPKAQIVRSFDDLLGDPDLAMLVIGTPNETHFDFAKRALLAGKHVVVDKPLAATSAEALELAHLAAKLGLVLAPFQNRRWDGDFLTVQELLRTQTLGRLVSYESHFDRFRPIPRENTWKESGSPANGLLMDLGPHLVDQVLALFGPPKTITASVRTDRQGSLIEDAFDLCLGYEHMLAWCRSSMIACDAAPRFLLHGTSGSFRKDGVDPQEPALVHGASVPPMGSEQDWLTEDASLWGSLTIAPNPADPATLTRTIVPTHPGDYRLFYANVADAINGTTALAVTPEDGYRTIRLLELARESSHRQVTLPVTFETP